MFVFNSKETPQEDWKQLQGGCGDMLKWIAERKEIVRGQLNSAQVEVITNSLNN